MLRQLKWAGQGLKRKKPCGGCEWTEVGVSQRPFTKGELGNMQKKLEAWVEHPHGTESTGGGKPCLFGTQSNEAAP